MWKTRMKNKSEVLDNNTNSEEKAATLIQKKVRGFLNYKKYGIKHLDPNSLTKHPTFVVGNDPGFPKSINKFHESDEKIAVIATSGLRAVS
jgi:L-rhamnose isomerase